MSAFNSDNSTPLGGASRTPRGSVTDTELGTLLRNYRRSVASAYRAVAPTDMSQVAPGTSHVSPKIDGELWFLVMDGTDVFLANSTGSVIHGELPVLVEARQHAPRARGRTVLAGELFALVKDARPRVGDLAHAMGGGKDAEVKRLGFQAFDLLEGGSGTAAMPLESYTDRYAVLTEILEGGKRCRLVPTETAASAADLTGWYEKWVDGGKAEGLVVRAANGWIYKVKPEITVDAVVVGFTTRRESPEEVRSISVALRRDHDQFQMIGACGNLGDAAMRKDLYNRLAKIECPSSFRKASSSGALYRFAKPEVVVEIKGTDVQSIDSRDDAIRKMVMEHGDDGWCAIQKMPGASVIHPVLTRIREDKTASREEIRIEQVMERCLVVGADAEVAEEKLPESEVIRRECYTKVTKDLLAVRKLMVWKTNKQDEDGDFPAFVVHWTDYAPGRKDPIKHTVKPVHDEASATEVAEALIEKNIKKGWVLA